MFTVFLTLRQKQLVTIYQPRGILSKVIGLMFTQKTNSTYMSVDSIIEFLTENTEIRRL